VCDAVTMGLASLAIKTAGDVGDYIAQKRNAKANKDAAIASQVGQVNDINLRELQEKQAASQEIQAAERQTKTVLSSARLSASEAGVSGVSVDALLNDIGAESSTYKQDVAENLSNTQAQLERQKQGVYAETQSRINSVQSPNPFALALRIGGGIIGTAAQFQSRKDPLAGNPNASAAPSAPTPRSSLRIGGSDRSYNGKIREY
jgi:hypothetical protein